MKKVRPTRPIERLAEDLEFLDGFIENPASYGAVILIKKIKGAKNKTPINVNLLDFKIKVNRDIKRIAKKIEAKLGFNLPE